MRVLDSHLHLWDPALLDYTWLAGPLAARFGAAELRSSGAVGDDLSFVFVQAECVPEQYLDEVVWVAGQAPELGIRGIVAGARLDRGEDTLRHLDALAAHPLVVGVRHLLQGEPVGFAGTSEFRAGAAAVAARGWTFDACVGAHQISDVTALAASIPSLRIVLDHLGKPFVGSADAPSRPDEGWVRDLHELAEHPQVFCKLSGLPAEAGGNWSAAQLEPFLDVAVSAFGVERLMFGSDWPVSAVRPASPVAPAASAGVRPAASAASASASASAASAWVDPAAPASWTDAVASWAHARQFDLDAVLQTNAERFYGL